VRCLSPGDAVVLVTHALPPGGAERQWCYLAQALKSQGYRVSFIVISEMRGDAAHYLPLLRDAGIEPIELGSLSFRDTLQYFPQTRPATEMLAVDGNPVGLTLGLMTSTIASLKPSAVFAQLDSPNLIAGVSALLADVPRTVLSFRNYNPSNFPYINTPWFHPVYSELCKSSRIVLSGNSRAGNRDYAAWLGIPEERITCIPNAVDPGQFEALTPAQAGKLRSELGLTEGTPLILGVFRLSAEKRPGLFLDVCAKVIRSIPTARAAIIGVGPMAGELKERIRKAGMSGKIALLGVRDDVASIMQVASLLLLTSEREGMPNVVLEAQAVGLPVVATKVGGVADCTVHGQTALLADVEDTGRLFDHCVELLTEPALAARMGQRGRALMREGYSKQAMAARFVALVNGEVEDRLDQRGAAAHFV
jgi:glycosyltransferase involved in cell wall biosynthesis